MRVLEEKRKALLALKTEERGGGRQGVAGHAAAFSKGALMRFSSSG
jgi:hypothetical protein